jgi:hypothetical protein
MNGGLVLLAWISAMVLITMAVLYAWVDTVAAACLFTLACLCAVFAIVFREPRANGRHHEQDQEEGL